MRWRVRGWLRWTETVSILRRINKDKDHVAHITRVRVKRCQIVLITGRIRVAPLESEVQDRHSPFIEEFVERRTHLGHAAENLTVRLTAPLYEPAGNPAVANNASASGSGQRSRTTKKRERNPRQRAKQRQDQQQSGVKNARKKS
jgi:hypothetical protein